jgi:hypothetical protein
MTGAVSLALATGGLTAGGAGGNCGSGDGYGPGGFGGLSVATTAGGAGFSATAPDFSATVAGFGCGLEKEFRKVHPPAIQTAIVKTAPAVRTAFCRLIRRAGEDVPLGEGDTSLRIGSEMPCLP